MEDFVKKELGASVLTQKNIDDDKYDLDFSIYETETGSEVLQNICKNTNFFYRTRISDSTPQIIGIEETPGSTDKDINVNSIIDYRYSKTPIKDIKLGVVVEYGFNYITEKLTKKTNKVSHKEGVGGPLEDYLSLYNIDSTNIDKHILEHKAPYIQNKTSAVTLAAHLFELNKNQHLIIDFSISLSEVIELEVGDVIGFKDNSGNLSNIGDVKPYGQDMTSTYTLINQTIFPYFMIVEIKKDLKKSSIRCVQLHQPVMNVPQYEGDIWE